MSESKPKSFIFTNAEKDGYDGKSYEQGFFDALKLDENKFFDSEVTILPLETKGILVGIYLSRSYGIEYKVRYYIDGKQCENYFYEREIK